MVVMSNFKCEGTDNANRAVRCIRKETAMCWVAFFSHMVGCLLQIVTRNVPDTFRHRVPQSLSQQKVSSVGHDWKTNGAYPIRRSHTYDGCWRTCVHRIIPCLFLTVPCILYLDHLDWLMFVFPLCFSITYMFLHYLHVFPLCFSDSCFSRCSDSYVLSCSILFYAYYYFLFSRVV